MQHIPKHTYIDPNFEDSLDVQYLWHLDMFAHLEKTTHTMTAKD